MNKKNIKIGFIGAGLMGYGMALNLLKKNYNLAVIAHNNRKPIDKLVKKGAKEFNNLSTLGRNCNIIVICVTNTPVAIKVINKLNND